MAKIRMSHMHLVLFSANHTDDYPSFYGLQRETVEKTILDLASTGIIDFQKSREYMIVDHYYKVLDEFRGHSASAVTQVSVDFEFSERQIQNILYKRTTYYREIVERTFFMSPVITPIQTERFYLESLIETLLFPEEILPFLYDMLHVGILNIERVRNYLICSWYHDILRECGNNAWKTQMEIARKLRLEVSDENILMIQNIRFKWPEKFMKALTAGEINCALEGIKKTPIVKIAA